MLSSHLYLGLPCDLFVMGFQLNIFLNVLVSGILCTRVGTLIVATIYLQLIQNRYMFRSFTVLQCSHQHCVQPVASDVEVAGYLLAAPVVLIVRMERSTA